MRKGSITIFLILSMMLVASALFALLEASRFQSMKRITKMQAQAALESAFAEYNTYLWEDYRLLACRQSEINNRIEQNTAHRSAEKKLGTNFYQFRVEQIQQEGYTRLTDENGSGLIQAASHYMEQNLLYETAKKIYNQYEGIKNIEHNSEFDFSIIEKALKRIQTEENNNKNSVGSIGVTKKDGVTKSGNNSSKNSYKDQENPLKLIQNLQKKGILALVIKDTSQLSEKEIKLSEMVSQREMPESYNSNIKESDWYTKVLFQQYLLTYLSNYMDEKGHVLEYELEYLLGGKETEIKNMKAVVNQLLGLREAANFLYLSSQPEKVEQARVLAVAIAGVSLSPAVINVVKTAVLAAWAFAESVLDIRTLLTGGKIALLKSDKTWTLDLEYITTIGEGYKKAKNCENGLNYTEYLGILLLFQRENNLALRTLDAQELTLRKRYEDKSISMEDWIVHVDVNITYQYKPVFFSIGRILPFWDYEIRVREQLEY